jgi:HK97 family phage major capsid protein
MQLSEISERVHALGNAWEQFKAVNDQRLRDIERKGAADPLDMHQLDKINDALDGYKDRLARMEIAVSRPGKLLDGNLIESGASAEHKAAFCQYLRKGADSHLQALEKKALSVGSDPDGGYLVTSSMSQTIVKTIFETSPLRKLAAVQNISTDSLEIIEDRNTAVAGWTSETASVSDTTTPQIGKKTIPVFELYAQPKATQKLIDDASIDVEAWLADKLADIFGRMENTAFISGDGVGQPRGILTYTAGTDWGQIQQVISASDGAVTADSLFNLYYSLKETYAARASFLMNRAVVKSVRLLKEATTNQYLWAPGLVAGVPDTLLGAPVHQAADMPTAATGSLSIALGDFGSAYQIVDRIGIRTLRDPFTDKPFVKFYTTKRVGGDVVNFEAVKLLKLSAS